MTAEQKFTLWLAGAAVCFLLAVVVSVLEGPRWAVGPLIVLALLCCVGMINNAIEQPAARGREAARSAPARAAAPTAQRATTGGAEPAGEEATVAAEGEEAEA